MPSRPTLIYNDECPACSALAQLIGTRAPDIRQVSVYSPRAQILLRPRFPGGWAVRPYLILPHASGERVLSGAALTWHVARLLGPTGIVKAAQALLRGARRKRARGGWAAAPADQMRAYAPASPADAAAFAGEPLLLPGAQPDLAFERVVQWYNLKGAFQTATYWRLGDTGQLVLEQVHRPSPAPEVAGGAPELISLGETGEARCTEMSGAEGPAVTLILPLPDTRWLVVRATGLARDRVIALARSCAPLQGL